MIPLVLIVAGAAALAIGVSVLRRYGSRFRVGRLLAATPVIPIAEARELATGPARYVGVQGRLDAEAPFEDDAHRPLVLRRARIQVEERRDWRTVDEHREAVPFEVHEGLDTIEVDGDALEEGLVVVPRESVGRAGDVPDRVPDGTQPDRAVRLRVEQVSAVEHAIVLGVPTIVDGDPSRVRMTAGLGRPLILTTLQRDEAMRVLTGGDRRGPLVAAIAFAVGAAMLTIGLVWAILGAWTATALAASPTPTPGTGGDPRSDGQGPGLVGEPLVAIGAVLALGILTVVATTVYVRLSGGRRR